MFPVKLVSYEIPSYVYLWAPIATFGRMSTKNLEDYRCLSMTALSKYLQRASCEELCHGSPLTDVPLKPMSGP